MNISYNLSWSLERNRFDKVQQDLTFFLLNFDLALVCSVLIMLRIFLCELQMFILYHFMLETIVSLKHKVECSQIRSTCQYLRVGEMCLVNENSDL